MAFATNTARTFDNQKVDENLRCPICLEAFKTPRSLACLHTFCEGCITSCVLEAVGKGGVTKSIQCPICRKETLPPTPSKPPTEWAKELPLNDAIVPMLEAMESESRKVCDSCKRREKNNVAVKFCVDCKTFQCELCVDFHKAFQLMEDHKMVGLDDESAVQQLNIGVTEYCKEHAGKKLKIFCADHDVCCCNTCAFFGHRTCKTVTEIKKLGEDLRQSGQLNQVMTDMDTLQGQVDKMAKTIESNLDSVVKQAVTIPQEMRDIRTKVIQIFDELVNDVTTECGQLKKQELTEIEDKKTTLRSLEAAITVSFSLLKAVEKHGTGIQVFMAYRQFQEQVRQYKKHKDNFHTTLVSDELKLCLSELLNNLLQSTEALARVTLDQVHLVPPLSECVVRISPHIDLQTQGQLIGAQHLPNGQLLVTNYQDKSCCLLDDKLSVIVRVKLFSTSDPRDVALMGPSEAVVVLQDSRKLQRVSIGTTLTLNGTIPCTRTPRCLSHISDTELAVGWAVGLGIIHLDGTEKFYMDKDKSGRQIKFSIYCHLVVDSNASHIYQSSHNDSKVHGMKMTGEPLFAYTMEQPYGLALDRDRNICVCSHTTSSVHQISPDGRCIRIIELDFNNIYTIAFNSEGTEMTVMSVDLSANKAVRVRFDPKN